LPKKERKKERKKGRKEKRKKEIITGKTLHIFNLALLKKW